MVAGADDVRQDFGGLGARAFELLRGAMSGEVVRRTSSELPVLIVRESAASPRQPSAVAAAHGNSSSAR